MAREPRKRPEPWREKRASVRHGWLLPVYSLNWFWEWLAHLLGNWVFLEVLEYLGKFTVLIAVIFYFAESGDRKKQKHYQAWQVINTAQGKGGSGGRIEALQELNADGVPLVGVGVTGAFLLGARLVKADLSRSTFNSADLRFSSLEDANLDYASFDTANLRGASLRKSSITHADLSDADLFGADLSQADLSGTHL